VFEADDAKTNLNRRQLLRGRLHPQSLPVRPPWACQEDEFVRLCSRCDACIDTCWAGILIRGSGGFPEADFHSSGCDFCADCLKACKTGALSAAPPAPSLAWRQRASIEPSCLSLNGIVCRSCGDACDTDAIRFQLQTGGRATPLLDSERCNGCGECFAVCPNDSISLAIPEAS